MLSRYSVSLLFTKVLFNICRPRFLKSLEWIKQISQREPACHEVLVELDSLGLNPDFESY